VGRQSAKSVDTSAFSSNDEATKLYADRVAESFVRNKFDETTGLNSTSSGSAVNENDDSANKFMEERGTRPATPFTLERSDSPLSDPMQSKSSAHSSGFNAYLLFLITLNTAILLILLILVVLLFLRHQAS
jgi:hypothetical protein